MQVRVIRMYPGREPRHLDWESAPLGNLSQYVVGDVPEAALTIEASSPRRLLPDLQGVELDGIVGDGMRLRGHEVVDGRRRAVVWVCRLERR